VALDHDGSSQNDDDVIADNLIAMGFQRQEQGKTLYVWRGTGFFLAGGPKAATAPHVVDELMRQVASFRDKGIQADMVCCFQNQVSVVSCPELLLDRRKDTNHRSGIQTKLL
jgi:hypothetical protein